MLQGSTITRVSIILDMPRNFYHCRDQYRKCTDDSIMRARSRMRFLFDRLLCEFFFAASSKGVLNLHQRVAVTTVEQLLPLALALGKNTGKSRGQISATMDRKRCIWIHCLRLPCIDTKFRTHQRLNNISPRIVKS